jgi:putative FmdB family regulatory protein
MPIYEYRCTKCGNEFEKFQSITDEMIPKCTVCRGKAKKLISQSSFHLKGSGWYVTDYGGKKPSDTDNKGKPSESSSDGSDTAHDTSSPAAGKED